MAELLHLDQTDDAYFGQSFVGHSVTPDADWLVESVWHERFFATTTNGGYCYIYADSSDEPTGSILATSNVVNGMATTDTGAPTTFTFPTPYLMTSGVPYWFVWHVASFLCFYWYGGGDHYLGGSMGYSTHATQPVGNWIKSPTTQASGMKVNGSIYIPIYDISIGNVNMSGMIIGG